MTLDENDDLPLPLAAAEENWIVIGAFPNMAEANVAAVKLEEAGIESFVESSFMDMTFGNANKVQLFVLKKDIESAGKILFSVEMARRKGMHEANLPGSPPSCPKCGSLRTSSQSETGLIVVIYFGLILLLYSVLHFFCNLHLIVYSKKTKEPPFVEDEKPSKFALKIKWLCEECDHLWRE